MSKNRIVAGLGDFDKDKTVVNDAVVSEDETWSSQKISDTVVVLENSSTAQAVEVSQKLFFFGGC